MLPHPRQFAAVLMICVLLAPSSVSGADALVIPRELADLAVASGCEPINNFFERPGMVDPPYVYGWLPGARHRSAAFWCMKTGKSPKPYTLLFKPADAKQLGGCPAAIDWADFPAGLSVEIRPRLTLSMFHDLLSPQQAGPPIDVANAKVLVNYYDGVSDIFYCYDGRWLVAGTD